VFARDRNGAVFSEMAPATQIRSMDLRASIKPRLARASIILSMRGGLSAFGVLARISGCTLRPATPSARRSAALDHLVNVAACARRFDDWMVRFHGVATRYLDNYLAWHRVVDQAAQLGGGFRLMRWTV
jgi:hypothetical protein